MPNIDQYMPGSGRRIKENGEVINQADMIEAIYNALVVNKNAGMQLMGSNVAQPVDIQARYSQTIQTHNAVSVGVNSSSDSVYIDVDGFSEVAITFMNDAVVNSDIYLRWSNDGINLHGSEKLTSVQNDRYKAISVPIKSRNLRVSLINADPSLAHTMSAWAYLKA